jgi:hypothetical protein
MRHGNVAMTDRHYTKLRTSDLRAALQLAVARPVEPAATGTETLTPKLTPTPPESGRNGGRRGADCRSNLGASREAQVSVRGATMIHRVHRGATTRKPLENTAP